MTFEIKQFFAHRQPPSPRFAVNGIGVEELMSPGCVNRPGGTGDTLLMFFPQPTAAVTVDGAVTLPASTLMIWPDRSGHFYGCADREWRHSWLHCTGHALPHLLRETGLPPGRGYRCTADLANRWLRMMYGEMTGAAEPDPDILQGMFALLLRETARLNRPPSGPTPPPGLLLARRFIEAHYREPLQLRRIAAAGHLSEPHLCALFRRHYRTSPINYAIELRLQEAEHLLTDHNRKLSDIAAATGFSDIYYFCRQFRRRRGLPPGEWRQRAETS